MANENWNEEDCRSQKNRILAYLKSGKSLTQMEALYKFGCFRLASRINDLRNDGLAVITDKIKLPNGKMVACYHLPLENTK